MISWFQERIGEQGIERGSFPELRWEKWVKETCGGVENAAKPRRSLQKAIKAKSAPNTQNEYDFLSSQYDTILSDTFQLCRVYVMKLPRPRFTPILMQIVQPKIQITWDTPNDTPYSSYSPSYHHETNKTPTQHQSQSQSKHVPTHQHPSHTTPLIGKSSTHIPDKSSQPTSKNTNKTPAPHKALPE